MAKNYLISKNKLKVKFGRYERNIHREGSCVDVFSLVLLIIMIGAAVFYCDLNDYEVYYSEYNSIANTGHITARVFEKGFILLYKLFIAFGAPFQVFYAVYMGSCILLLYKFILKKQSKHIGLVLFSVIVFPYINYLQQIRSALAAILIMLALDFLQPALKRKGIAKFLLVLLLVCSLQVSSLAYIVFIFASWDVSKRTFEQFFIGVYIFVAFIMCFFYGKICNMLILLFEVLGSHYGDFISDPTRLSTFARFNIIIYAILLVCLLYLGQGKKSEETDFLYKCSLIIADLSLLVCFAAPAYRLACVMLPVVYVTIVRLGQEAQRKSDYYISIIAVILLPCAMMFLYWGPKNPAMFTRLTTEMWRVASYFRN